MKQRKSYRRKYHFIYKTTCIVTSRYYIGMHSTDEIEDGYLGSGKRLRYSVRKYGQENHERVILEDCSKEGREYLRERERFWVDDERLNDPMCMNITKGGPSGPEIHSFQTKKKMGRKRRKSAWNKGMSMAESTKSKISSTLSGRKQSKDVVDRRAAANKGKKRTQETKDRISLANKGKKISGHPCSLKTRKKISGSRKGMKFSDEHRLAISNGCKGRIPWNKGKKGAYTRSEETRMKMSTSHTGKKHSEETKQKMREAAHRRERRKKGLSD